MSSRDLLLEDLAAPVKNAIVGGPFGSNLVSKDYVAQGIPVIRGQNMSGKWVSGDFVFVSPEKALQIQQNKARPGDVVFTQRGTLGQVSIVPALPYSEYVVSQSQMKITVDPSKADSQFIYYLFRSEEQLRYIFNSAIQTGVPHTNLGLLRKTPVTVPSLEIQKAIAGFLCALDDRITLLRETNTTLEAIAQALFKSWFVDFDPVHANIAAKSATGGAAQGGASAAQGTTAGMPEAGQRRKPLPPMPAAALDAATAALFPDSFEESELGLVPKGWVTALMADISTVGIGKTPPRKEQQWFSEDLRDVRWVSIRDMGAVGVYANQTSEYLTSEAVEKFNVRRVPDNTVLMSFKMTIGRVAITEGEMTTNEAIAHFRLDASSPLSSEYIYLHLRQFDFSRLSSTSSIAEAVNSKTVREIPILVPSKQVAAAFQDQISTVFARLKKNEQQAQTLTQLRDTLLPRLISGQLRLPEAEAEIEGICP